MASHRGTSRSLEHVDRPTIEITATPCRHGPPGSHPIVGDVIGFSLRWEGQRHGTVWISGDTVLYDGLHEVARRTDVGTAIVHLGGVRFPVSGPLRYTMLARQAVELARLLDPHTLIPVHYEGWSHFREPPSAAVEDLAPIGTTTRTLLRWLSLGEPVELEV